MNWIAPWITPACDMGSKVPCFAKAFRTEKPVVSAVLRMTAMGVYDAAVNGKPVTDTVLNPGWTTYQKRMQVQTWDVTDLIGAEKLNAVLYDGPTDTLIPHEGAPIRQQERIRAARMFTTPKGENVIDFGQEVPVSWRCSWMFMPAMWWMSPLLR